MDDQAVITLIDLQPHIPTNLLAKFKKKLCSPVSIEFSQNFTKIKNLSEPDDSSIYNLVICQELNYLIAGANSVIVYDLITHERLLHIPFDDGIYSLDLEREFSGQLNLIISSSTNELFKYNFTEMIKNKEVGEPIWKAEMKFQHIWGVKCFKTEIYVIDYAQKMFVYDSKTGKLRDDIQIDLDRQLVDLVFTPEEEMIVCGVDQLHIMKFNENSATWEKIKTLENTTPNRCFSVWYEKKTRLIYLTDANGKIYILDRQFNILKTVTELESLSSPYGIVINDKNGELFLCNSGTKEILIYK
ncbi:predicted protein [Naegleria gruberi]|uniref:Predicted protein n=1 Tax=Naegleria gruberi TaxID=5762 RepID=D2VYL4_NAEGR|nr:uncharacterized protein NAEGRDRAFT_74162 [Naegleria gruberi]EFC38134.1 predicted protein [Naegleria gruberi]|eukprot:XP_002670878.1 predicted protein [Naegleria gruberi strain NEG-M]